MAKKDEESEKNDLCDAFEAFARGVASVIGKGCWDKFRHDIVRRSTNKELSKSVVVDESGVSLKISSGTIEFHRLIYVLATYEATFADLPGRFPARKALQLSGIRFLTFRHWKRHASNRDRTNFEKIASEFPLWKFLLSNNIATDIRAWRVLHNREEAAKTVLNHDDALSTEISLKVKQLEEVTKASLVEYKKNLVEAFGTRFEDKELKVDLDDLARSDVWPLLPWAQFIIEANSSLLTLLSNVIEDHSVWRQSE